MAFFNDMVRALADAEGMDEMTVRGIGIIVRDKGHISKGGRGLSAAKMTAKDATNLLIGVNGSSSNREAGEIVDEFRSFRQKSARGLLPNGKGPLWDIIMAKADFGDVLECMMATAFDSFSGEDKLGTAVVDGFDFPKGGVDRHDLISDIHNQIRLEINFLKPSGGASLELKERGGGYKFVAVNFLPDIARPRKDRLDLTIISQITVLKIAKALVK
ncbi:hypothetical protein [Methylobacterium sp. 174MFSha1.1]|uniref:hypothetical protein n=1 Tax=Methylobacterium sp. 174MFSha1.1 TaxID=1502749 RepID=UPI0011602761|nr:hypothetical protein [Methylobacterium sp. 174MFSha1.1]